jgi:hypothetical protein
MSKSSAPRRGRLPQNSFRDLMACGVVRQQVPIPESAVYRDAGGSFLLIPSSSIAPSVTTVCRSAATAVIAQVTHLLTNQEYL